MATVESPFPEAVLGFLGWSGRRLQNHQSYLVCVELPPGLHPVETGWRGGRGVAQQVLSLCPVVDPAMGLGDGGRADKLRFQWCVVIAENHRCSEGVT